MKRTILLWMMAFSVCPLLAGIPKGGYGIDAFNRVVSASSRESAVFSPASFEFDSVIFSEAHGALIRAKIAETMGVLTGLEAYYKPLYESLSRMTNGVTFTSARAFCLPDERKSHPAYRQWMQTAFAAEAFTFAFRPGAECWFRARMEGDMEDFVLPDKAAADGYYSYFDLVSISATWQGPVHLDSWKRTNHTVLRLPLQNDMWFYALIPKEGVSIRDIRKELSSATLLTLLTGFKSVTEEGISHGVAHVALPKMDILSQSDLKQPFAYFHIPLTDMDRMEKDVRPRYVRQRVHFRLNEEKGAASTPSSVAAGKSYHLDRPFIFFIYHEPTTAIPIVGVYQGQSSN